MSASTNLLTVSGVPYLRQRDNGHRPSGTCNLSCVAMLAVAAGGRAQDAGGGQLADRMYDELRSPEGKRALQKLTPLERNNGLSVDLVHAPAPERVHAMLAWLLRRHGYPRAEFVGECTRDRILRIVLDERLPVIVAGAFTRSNHHVRSGHMVVVVGGSRGGDLLVNDPWGDWTRQYAGDAGQSGEHVVYPAGAVWGALGRPGKSGYWTHVPGSRSVVQ